MPGLGFSVHQELEPKYTFLFKLLRLGYAVIATENQQHRLTPQPGFSDLSTQELLLFTTPPVSSSPQTSLLSHPGANCRAFWEPTQYPGIFPLSRPSACDTFLALLPNGLHLGVHGIPTLALPEPYGKDWVRVPSSPGPSAQQIPGSVY